MKTKQLTISAVFCAIIIMMGYFPNVGYITIPFTPISTTIIFIPVIIGTLLVDKKYSFIFGLTFGLMSIYVAFTRPVSIFDYFFQNPLVSVVPRVIFSIIVWPIFQFTSKYFISKNKIITIFSTVALISLLGIITSSIQNSEKVIISIVIALILAIIIFATYKVKDEAAVAPIFSTAFLSIIIHSFLVLLAIFVLYANKLSGSYGSAFSIIGSIFVFQSVTEAIFNSFIITIVYRALKRAKI